MSLLCGALVLAGCGETPAEPGGSGSTTSPATATDLPTTAATPTTPRTSPPTKPVTPPPPDKSGTSTTLRGKVSRVEVEGGCLVLDATNGGRYQLTGKVGDLRPGMTASVRGRVDPGLRSTCQVGPILVVEEVLESAT